MSNAAFYQWRSKFGGMDASLMKRMKAISEEDAKVSEAVVRVVKRLCLGF